MAKLAPEHIIYLRSMGKALRITAMFGTDDEANAYLEKHRDEGVIAVIQDIVFIANLHDKGMKIAE